MARHRNNKPPVKVPEEILQHSVPTVPDVPPPLVKIPEQGRPEPLPPASCSNCPYWKFVAADKDHGPVGECRRLPPDVRDPSLLTLSGPLVRFGLTSADTSCGEHPRFLSPAS